MEHIRKIQKNVIKRRERLFSLLYKFSLAFMGARVSVRVGVVGWGRGWLVGIVGWRDLGFVGRSPMCLAVKR